jgi:hypothetical protein
MGYIELNGKMGVCDELGNACKWSWDILRCYLFIYFPADIEEI